jgi:hypothetical protein
LGREKERRSAFLEAIYNRVVISYGDLFDHEKLAVYSVELQFTKVFPEVET